MKHVTALLLLICCISTAQAETGYVTDSFKVTLRSGESSSHKILRMLPSGTAIEIVSANPESGYSFVRTQGGAEGYILTRQLLKQPTARLQLDEMKAKVEALQRAPGELQKELQELQEKHNKLSKDHKALTQTKNKLEKDLNSIRRTAANAVRISNERNELSKQVATLTRNVEELKQENKDLSNQTAQDWFLIGAAVIIGGIIIGLILPHLRFQRRKSSWDSL